MSDEELKLETTPTNLRFPTTNQAKACYMYYNSWHQCKYDKGDEDAQCTKLKSWAMSMCPIEWVRVAPRGRLLPPPPPRARSPRPPSPRAAPARPPLAAPLVSFIIYINRGTRR